jgi:hypothetical protein
MIPGHRGVFKFWIKAFCKIQILAKTKRRFGIDENEVDLEIDISLV